MQEYEVIILKKVVHPVLAIIILIITMTACGKSEEEKIIVGSWRYDVATYYSVLTFNEDMTCSETIAATSSDLAALNLKGTKTGTYEIKKGILTIYFNGDSVPKYLVRTKFEDNKMIWENMIEDIVYVRES